MKNNTDVQYDHSIGTTNTKQTLRNNNTVSNTKQQYERSITQLNTENWQTHQPWQFDRINQTQSWLGSINRGSPCKQPIEKSILKREHETQSTKSDLNGDLNTWFKINLRYVFTILWHRRCKFYPVARRTIIRASSSFYKALCSQALERFTRTLQGLYKTF